MTCYCFFVNAIQDWFLSLRCAVELNCLDDDQHHHHQRFSLNYLHMLGGLFAEADNAASTKSPAIAQRVMHSLSLLHNSGQTAAFA